MAMTNFLEARSGGLMAKEIADLAVIANFID